MTTKAVLITGAAKRIGKAIAEHFAAQDYKVALHFHRSKKEAESLAASLPTQTHCFSADLKTLTPAHANKLWQEAEQQLGVPITCLVNNASIFEDDLAHPMDETLLDTHLAINLKAPLFLSNAMAAAGEQQAIPRHIIMLLDQKVRNPASPSPHFFSYNLSKLALWDATQMLASTFAPLIRVNGIAPGPILPSIHQTQAAFDKSVEKTPLQTKATPDDIAKACLFLEQQTATTAQLLTLDGGQHLG